MYLPKSSQHHWIEQNRRIHLLFSSTSCQTLDRHFRQTGSENVIFFIARAERNKRRRLFVHPKVEPPPIRLSHPAQVKRSDLGILLYVVLILNRV